MHTTLRLRSAQKAVVAVVVAATGSLVPSAMIAGPAGAAPPVGGTWNLAFADEFDGTALNAQKWHTCHWWASTTCSIETNNELELYTRDNVSVANGMLKLQARRENAVAWNGNTYNYTSGMVSTGGKVDEIDPGFVFTYGYVEARVKVPKGQGLWPALWLLPANHEWPPEIDVMEILGDSTNVQHMNYHYPLADGSAAKVGSAWTGPDFSADWHTFGVDWSAEAIVWYVDGVERFRYSDASNITSEPSYVLLNLAVGGNWPGSPDATTPFPSDYLVDYLRIWNRAGTGTADTVSPSVTITSPAQGSSVGSRNVTVTASASDNVGVTRTEVLIDGALKASSPSKAISYVWNTKKVAAGPHVITVRSFDAAGNVGQSAVTVYR
jgi:beta-glucanase (GH16 family)